MQALTIDGESAPLEISMSVVRGCLVVPIQMELHDDTVLRVQESILKKIEATGVKGVVIDLSTMRVLDTFVFEAFANTARTASLLGATTIFAGIQPGVAWALVDLEVEFEDIRTALSLEHAFGQLEPIASSSTELEAMEDAVPEEEVIGESECDGEEQDV